MTGVLVQDTGVRNKGYQGNRQVGFFLRGQGSGIGGKG